MGPPAPSLPLESLVKRDWPTDAWRDLHVVMAVSGGPDSVAMLRALTAIKIESGGAGRLYVAHYDHNTRNGQSAHDAVWVAELASRLGLECLSGASTESGRRSEEALRDERRGFYLSAAQQVGARYVATAHTADDQAETVLFRILRGTGLSGLTGIARYRPLSDCVTLIRPLLEATRAEILDHLQRLAQDYRVDPTNAVDDATRNWLRNELIPSANIKYRSDVREALRRIAGQAAEAFSVVHAQAEAYLITARVELADDHSRVRIARSGATAPPIVVREALRLVWRRAGWPEKALAQRHWESLHALLMGESGEPANLPGNVIARSDDGVLELSREDRF